MPVKQDAKGIQNMSGVNMRQLECNAEAVLFFRGGGGGYAPPTPTAWGFAPDPVFREWYQVPIGFKHKYTKLHTNQAITSLNITILV